MKAVKMFCVVSMLLAVCALCAGEQVRVLPVNAILPVRIKLQDAPEYLAKDFYALLENSLLQNGVRLHNMQQVNQILARNELGKLDAMEPRWFAAVGKLLQVRSLIMVTVTRFEVIKKEYHVSESGASGERYIGYQEGFARVVSAQTGEVLASVPFEQQIDFRQLPRSVTRDWMSDDYFRHMTKEAVKMIVPQLLKVSALSGEVTSGSSSVKSSSGDRHPDRRAL